MRYMRNQHNSVFPSFLLFGCQDRWELVSEENVSCNNQEYEIINVYKNKQYKMGNNKRHNLLSGPKITYVFDIAFICNFNFTKNDGCN